MSYLALHRADYDVIHVNTLKYAASLAALCARGFGLPVVGRSLCAGPEGDMAHLRTLPMSRLVLQCLHQLDRVVALSAEIREELLENGFAPEKVALIPNAIDEDRFRPATEDQRDQARQVFPEPFRDRLIVVTTARLVKQKGIKYLISALGEADISARWAAIVLGEGDEQLFLQAQAAESGLEGNILFAGATGNVLPYLHGADVFCLPSLYEGMSNSLLEAMACGLPVLATRVSGTVDIVEEDRQGILVDPANPRQLAEGLRRMQDQQVRADLGGAARRKVETTCGLQHIARRYTDLYRQIISEK